MSTGQGSAEALQDGFVALLEEHAGIVHRVARMYAKRQEDREDLIQEIRLQLWRGFPRYRAGQPFSTWMYRVALNTGISWLRRHERQPVGLAEAGQAPAPEAPEPDPRAELLWTLIGQLDPLHRALLMLSLDGVSLAEMGEVMGMTPSTAAVRLSRIRQRLRELAAAAGASQDLHPK